jgi:sulfoxide reductase heme-binding subunit YedZ
MNGKFLIKLLTFALSLMPALYIGYQIWLIVHGQPNSLGPDPGKEIVHFNGRWALRFLLITLTVTPLRQLTGWTGVARLRRMLGLFTFFYATLHILSYLAFLLEFRVGDLIADVAKRPYILAGFLAFCGLIPLAATSNQWMMRRLKQRWKRLHRIIYGIAVAAIIHLLWLTRSDYGEVAAYAAVLAVLLGYRIARSARRRQFMPAG